ncbi:acyl-CoA carboxylase subunit beta [Chelatococcus reniformis]|uniref:Propionyl-CoA carboxylase subunit beta n=1 Tax=Chelatococcus reniformis TaxID=1494448 RepID=A0A916UA47_9HYPH|nr:carboxyl transferase domain-containing protein [Chelatococcus reniformis]GGC65006.1 propionyl-CoA carboxylase subunit beta [Chelatococcus reniformis]
MDLYDDFKQREAWALAGGRNAEKSAKLLEGKIFVRDRLDLFFDNGLEIEDGLLAGAEKRVPADAVVTGIGKVDGRMVAMIANDISVKAGSWGYQTMLKITRMQERARELKIPLVYFVDSAGARIDEQKQSYLGRTAWGNIFYNLVQLSGVVPQLCVLFGPSPAGAAYIPGLCDTVVMVDKKATAYVGSPRMAKMAIGEDISEEDLGGARMHCTLSGLGDILVQSDAEAIAVAKTYLGYFPGSWSQTPPIAATAAQAAPPDLEALLPRDQNVPFDIKTLIRALADDDSFLESKELFAKEMTTAFIRLGGRPIGVVANNSKFKGGVLFNDSSDKAARFIWLCNAFNIPLLFLQDISGYMIGSSVEKTGIIRHGAKLLSAVCEASVPRIAVMVRKAYGGGFLAMSGAPTKPDAMLALPTAMPALVGPEAAVNAMYFNQIAELAPADRAAFIKAKRDEYARDINVYSAAADSFASEAVVHPNKLRDELINRFALYALKPTPAIERRNAVHPV